MKSFEERREIRRLTSKRAGAFSQRTASQQPDRYMLAHLTLLVTSLVVILAISAGVWAVLWTRPGLQGLAAGFVAGVGVAFLYHWCVISSGAATGTMGQAAEELDQRRAVASASEGMEARQPSDREAGFG